MKYTLILICSLLVFSLSAQDDNIETLELKTPRYYNSLAFDFNMGGKGKDNSEFEGGIGFHYSVGYRMNKWLNFGAGTGFEFYNFDRKTVFVPIYAEVRGEFTNWRVAPFYQVELGMGFKVPVEYDYFDNKPKGVYFRPQIGWKFKRNNNFASTIGFGYQLQTSTEKLDNSWGDDLYIENRKRKYQRYFIQFGFEF